MVLNKIVSLIKGAGSIAILPHVSADGDALGSCLALGIAVKKLGKNAHVILEEGIPYYYQFLPDSRAARLYNEDEYVYDVVIAVDCGDLERLGKRVKVLESCSQTVNIDHHGTNTEFAGINYVDANSAASAEIIYQLVKMMCTGIDKDISTCLYTALSADTGGFRYSNTTSISHNIAADLINNGVSVAEVSQHIFETTSLAKVKLTGQAADSLELLENGKLAVITVTDDMMRYAGASDEDCEGIINIGRNIAGVEAAVMFRQRGMSEVKVNMRSKDYVDVSEVAAAFSGGGHKRAAGCTVNGDIEDIRRKVLGKIREAL